MSGIWYAHRKFATGWKRREWKKLVTYCTKTYTVSFCNPSVYCQIIPLFQGNFRYSVKTILQFLGIIGILKK